MKQHEFWDVSDGWHGGTDIDGWHGQVKKEGCNDF